MPASPVLKKKLVSAAQNLGLSAASLIVFYLFFELLVFPLSLIHLPHRLQWRVDAPLLVFNQDTRRGRKPRDYLAIVGDSYAVGVVNEDGPRKWSSRGPAANALLFESLGVDVAAWGQNGGGSLGGLVATPIGTYEFFKRTRFYGFEEPEKILAFFYEGNDLDDNVIELKERYDGRFEAGRFDDPEYFRGFIDQVVRKEHPLARRTADFGWTDNLLFLDFILEFTKKSLSWLFVQRRWANRRPTHARPDARPMGEGAEDEDQAAKPDKTSPEVNRARVGGKIVSLPEGLQSPGLELDAGEIARGVLVFEHSIRYLKSYFPKAEMTVVYIPSPLTCYELVSEKVSIETRQNRSPIRDAKLVPPASDGIEAAVRAASMRAGCGYVDAREVLRRAGGKRIIHGPWDWYHFNRHGYKALADRITAELRKEGR